MAIWFKLNYLEKRNKLLDMCCWFTYRTFSSVAAVETFFMYRYQFNLEIIFIGDKKLSLIVVATFFPVFRHLL